MNDKDRTHIDELLSSYLDDELSERQHTEVKRLISHDQRIAGRLRELEKCRELLGSLPHQEAPAGILEAVKESFAQTALVGEYKARREHRAGVRNLFVRRLAAAAAMIAVVGALGLVVFSIVRPQGGERELALTDRRPGTVEQKISPATTDALQTDKGSGVIFAQQPFVKRLELTTTESFSVNAVVTRAIYDNGLLDCASIRRQADETTYILNCTRENAAVLLADLKGVWQKFDRTRLAVAKPSFGEAVWIDDVSAEQVTAILDQDDARIRLAMAQDFAALNRIAKALPGGGALAALGGREYESLRVDKPVLTWGRPTRTAPQTEISKKQETTHLTIVVISKEK